ncbi:MAG: hypothetical protein D6812_01160 [Deltaproteobacteria bacterium]|nr:MAG: hypothetical protein D6812_01160 [Deltaproteobacteria bacterium]
MAQQRATRGRPFRFLLLLLLPLIVAVGGIVWFFGTRPEERVRNAAVEREAKTEEKRVPTRGKTRRVAERQSAIVTAKGKREATPPATPDVPEQRMGDLHEPDTDTVAKRRPPFKRPHLRSPKLSRIYEKRKGEQRSRKLGIKPGQPLRVPRPAPTPSPIQDMAAAPRVEEDVSDPLPEDIAPYDEDLAMAADEAAADEAAADDDFGTGIEPGEEYPEETEHLEAEEDY